MMNWIKVLNSLPEHGEYVLATDGKDIDIFKFIQTTDKSHKKRSGYFDSDCDYLGDITQWMPLPELPKEI